MGRNIVRCTQVLITGATSGIGLAAAGALAASGARVAIVGRDEARTREACKRVGARCDRAAVTMHLADLSSQKSIHRLAAEVQDSYPKLDVLINNAGGMHSTRQMTEDGVELTWAVNHVAPFLLTKLLLNRLQHSSPARVVTTAGIGHYLARVPFDDLNAEQSYGSIRRYCETKLANVLFTAELARRLKGEGVTANCCHPGVVASEFYRKSGWLSHAMMLPLMPFLRSPEQGADTLVWLATSPDAAAKSGGYFTNRQQKTPSSAARDIGAAQRLWSVTEQQIRAN